MWTVGTMVTEWPLCFCDEDSLTAHKLQNTTATKILVSLLKIVPLCVHQQVQSANKYKGSVYV